MAGTEARPEPGSDPPGSPSWRSGVGCGLTVLSVVALVVVGQLAGMLIHRPGADAPAAGTPAALVQRLDELPPAAQAVPATGRGVDRLLAGVGLPTGTSTDAEFQPGDTVIAIGITGNCVFVDVHQRRLNAWPAPVLAPCTAARAYRSVLDQRGAVPSADGRLSPTPSQ
ncbi:hypothetical protein GXW82_21680 [Streptacidiphilus sp. 4-A2]|nr:hypothetical protein [Streptacidiphilus sp. 4-A2]